MEPIQQPSSSPLVSSKNSSHDSYARARIPTDSINSIKPLRIALSSSTTSEVSGGAT